MAFQVLVQFTGIDIFQWLQFIAIHREGFGNHLSRILLSFHFVNSVWLSSSLSIFFLSIEKVISLDATDDFLKARVMNLPESVVAGTHNTEEGL